MTGGGIEEYADRLFGVDTELLDAMRREAEGEGIPMIHIPPELGRLLAVLIAASGARRVLEIGALFGLSAILMARALPPGGTLLTLEVDPTHARTARRNFERAGVSDRVELREGMALDQLRRLEGETFDLIFIDADKVSYPAYLEWALRLSHSGTVVVADNVWRNGRVAEPSKQDALDRAMAEFNQRLATEPRLLSTIIPSRGGSDAGSVSVVRSS